MGETLPGFVSPTEKFQVLQARVGSRARTKVLHLISSPPHAPKDAGESGHSAGRVYLSAPATGRTEIAGFMKNIVLIGMPGAGKSTVGVLLAKTLGRKFIDTDLLIQESAGRLLQEIIDADGPDTFKVIEEQTIISLHRQRAVIATGGSVVYSQKSMEHLQDHGVIIYLKISFEEMVKRLDNITTRGVVLHAGESLRSLYDHRVPLYEKYADITLECTDAHFESCIKNLVSELKKFHA
jgi:shikimate kinase